jgi:hypothetical protein
MKGGLVEEVALLAKAARSGGILRLEILDSVPLRLPLQRRGDSGGVRASLAIVARGVVFPDQSDGEALSPCGCGRLLGGKAGPHREAPNVREMLLQFVLGAAFHFSTIPLRPPGALKSALAIEFVPFIFWQGLLYTFDLLKAIF